MELAGASASLAWFVAETVVLATALTATELK